MVRETYLALLLSAAAFFSGCAAPMGAGAPPAVPGAPAPPPGTAPVNVAVPQHLDIDVYKHCSSIWDVLGIPEIARAFRNLGAGILHLGSRLFPSAATANPEREPGPPLLPVNSPANMNSSSPAIQSAAKIKADEDQSAQKIKAIKYLATIGCGGCYPGVEEAFLAALDDCTESVRYAAVNAIKETAGNACVYCSNKSCCSPKIRQKLMEMSQEGDCFDCAGEPSARVRRVARIALDNCGGKGLMASPDPVSGDIEGPTQTARIQTIPTTTQHSSNTLVSHQAMATEEVTPPVLTETDVQDLANAWLAELDPELPLHEKRDMIRRKMRNYLQTQNEREILLGDLMHELQVQHQLQAVTLAGQTTPQAAPNTAAGSQKPKARSVISDPQSTTASHQQAVASAAPPFPGMGAVLEAATDLPISEKVQLATGVTEAKSTVPQAGQKIRWESLVVKYSPSLPAAEARAQMIALRNYLQMDSRSAPPSESIRQHLQTATVPWTPSTAVRHAEKRQSLETLPVGEISPILEIEGGLEIVRVLQRAPLTQATDSASAR